tara:strand:- start:32668 stop:33579 length:912 start_codon:yes stop_codon:yes gene_type:complete
MIVSTEKPKFNYKDLPSLIKETYKAWDDANPWRLSAVVAYYAILSLPALLIIIINSIGAIWGTDIVQGQLTNEISSALGSDAAESIQTIISETQNEEKNLISTIIGIGTLLFGATGVFYQLKVSLNEIWKIKPDPNANFWKLLTDRARSFAFILVIGFLLLVSFIITAGISALNEYIRNALPDILLYVAYFLDFTLSIAIITVLFALMFRYLPDAKIKWKTVWKGALITAILFVIGKLLLGIYFGEANPGSTYGAAGTIVLILLWVSYSCLILFFGAEFTYVYAKRYGITIERSTFAKESAAN